ncbi:hypothetical protein SXCC_01577 [Gluconacetobacter sp. SXCC-1]|nr:hypothetical protein SXCC_01577 [Gluconacetobacter sp. SXCC-1]
MQKRAATLSSAVAGRLPCSEPYGNTGAAPHVITSRHAPCRPWRNPAPWHDQTGHNHEQSSNQRP